MKKKEFLSELMHFAWQFVKRDGLSISNAMKIAWLNAKLKLAMTIRLFKFYYQKVDGSIREAYATLNDRFIYFSPV